MRQFWVGPPSNGLFSHFLSDVPSRFQDEKENTIHSLGFLCHYSSVIAVILLLPLKRMGRKMLWTLFIVGLLGGEFAVKRLALLDIGNPLFVVLKSMSTKIWEAVLFFVFDICTRNSHTC